MPNATTVGKQVGGEVGGTEEHNKGPGPLFDSVMRFDQMLQETSGADR